MISDKPFTLKQHNNNKISTCALGSHVALMCPNCYATYVVEQFGAISAQSTTDIDLLVNIGYHIQCKCCHVSTTAITLDPPMAHVVSLLNKLGFGTEMCCGGHIDDALNPAFIKFRNIPKFENLPDGWSLSGVFLRADTTDHVSTLANLNRWVDKMYKRGRKV